ncbi:MAG: hypothetical protein IJB94_00705 [Clostridia bacterium]|nr:hypothetical protein [Clostridia bacterium]
MKEFNFSTLIKKSDNYTPGELMHAYAKQHYGVGFGFNSYNMPYIKLADVKYYYDRHKTIAISPNSEMVTVYLTDNPLVPMPGTEGDWGKKHWGGTK